MNLTVLKNAVTSRLGRQILTASKHSPVILFAAGVVGVGATVVLASRATLRSQKILDQHRHAVETASTLYNNPELNTTGEEYTSRQYKRDLAVIYSTTFTQLARQYGPSVVIGVAAIAALTGSHVVLTRRYAGVTAAYAAMHKGFDEYRKRVVEQFGDEKDKELRYGLVDRTVVEEGPEGPVTTTVKRLGDHKYSVYARMFEKGSSTSWSHEPGYNRHFIACQQQYANDKLRAQGHLFLNEVYDMLGLQRSKEGAVVGWVWGDCGDGYVDFGVFSGDRYMGMEFVKDNERAVMLDFNVTGVIYDLI